MSEKFIAPVLKKDAFHCPHCGVYARQYWYKGALESDRTYELLAGNKELSVSICERCRDYALWLNDAMIYPLSPNAPMPSEYMPNDVKDDYMEARNIVNLSPRAASALLRLSLQKLMVSLEEKGKDLNEDIGSLVKKGLPTKIQKALDCVRVIGNNAVHPGELDIKDDEKTATTLFDLVNMIVEDRITHPKAVDELYERIPKGAKEAIAKRDNRTTTEITKK
jgi:hypothetical protein